MGALTHNGEVLQSLPADASQINFNNTGTNLNSTQTENAIKEVNTKVNTNTDDITQLKSGLNSKVPFSIVTSGSLHDIKQSGIYYITGGVSDRPMDGGGMYIVSVHNSDLLVGIYVGFLKDNQNRQIQLVSLSGGNWIVADIASTQRT